MNKSILMGRMTKDIDLRQTNSGKTVGTFTVAVDDGYGDKKTTDFINCIAWEKQAGLIHNHFGKGRMIALIGKIKPRSWETNDGEKRYATEVVVNEIYFTGEKKEETPVATMPDVGMPVPDDDDLPF